MGFDAGKAVDPLDYDFTTAAYWDRLVSRHPELAEVGKGRVPDPSDGEVAEFRAKFAGIFGASLDEFAAGGIGAMTAKLQAELEGATDEEAQAAANDTLDAIYATVSEFCSGQPPAALLQALPGRYFFSFVAWLFGQIIPLADVTLPLPMRPARAGLNGGSSS